MTAPGEESDFLCARPGDHLFCPFECDACAFFRLKRNLPDPKSRTDSLLQIYIRRANLDAFWSRRPSTRIDAMTIHATPAVATPVVQPTKAKFWSITWQIGLLAEELLCYLNVFND